MELASVEHLALLAATLVLCVAAAVVPRRHPSRDWSVAARSLAVALIGSEFLIRLVLLRDGDWDWSTDLPLQLSDAALLAAAVALWSPSSPRLAYELTYFWAFTATLQALLTPDLNHGPGHVFFWTFFVAHSGVLVAVAFLTWGRRLTLGPRAVARGLSASIAWTALAAAGCLITGGNYMFLREPPPGGSVLDLFGPWPLYLVGAAALAFAAFPLLARLRRSDPLGP